MDEYLEMGAFFFEDPEIYDEGALKKWKADSPALVSTYKTKIEGLSESEFVAATLKAKLEETVTEAEVGFGKLMMPLRIAVSGQGFGPDLFPALALIGKEAVVRRIDRALEKLG